MSLASHMATPLKLGGLHGLAMLRPPTAPLTGMVRVSGLNVKSRVSFRVLNLRVDS